MGTLKYKYGMVMLLASKRKMLFMTLEYRLTHKQNTYDTLQGNRVIPIAKDDQVNVSV